MNLPLQHLVTISNAHTRKCLDLPSGSMQVGINIRQYQCHHGANQWWFIEQVQGGFRIGWYWDVWRRLAVPTGNLSDGAPIQLVNTSRNRADFDFQSWEFRPIGNNFLIVNKQSGKCLDVPGGLDWDSLAIQQYAIHSGPNQQWRITAI